MKSKVFVLAGILLALSFGCAKKMKTVKVPADRNTQTDDGNRDDNGGNGNDGQTTPQAPAKTLRLMSYNLHNMFDHEHDIVEGKHKKDLQYLPKKVCLKVAQEMIAAGQMKPDDRDAKCQRYDWTFEKYDHKLVQLKKVFDLRKTQLKEASYPEIVGFSEIENGRVLEDIGKMLGYKDFVISSSRDRRGIDVAFMYRPHAKFKFKAFKEYHLDGTAKRSRPILEAQFEFFGEDLFVYNNHWPSQRSPAEGRTTAAVKLMEIIESRHLENPKSLFLSMGDYNTKAFGLEKASPHPFEEVLYTSDLVKIHDARILAEKSGKKVAPGTYYYRRKDEPVWQHLDRFFISANLIDGDGVEVDVPSFRIFNDEKITRLCTPFEIERKYCHKGDKKPLRYNHNLKKGDEKQGFSDHYPIYLNLKVK